MIPGRKVVVLSDLVDERTDEALMRFRLIYDGELRPTGNDPQPYQTNPLAAHKQEIRQEFHRQLKQLWATNKFLREHRLSFSNPRPSRPIGDEGSYWGGDETEAPMADVLADQYREFGYRFVPLVREDISLLCSVSILFLRRDTPGHVISAGDIDNRLKTVIDALRRPRNATELVGYETPGEGENQFFCLLEDDKQVTHLEVETDTLLDLPIPNDDADHRRVRLVITVDIRPFYATMFNLSFVA